MNILILNWRDIKNPKSGGAEILTHEMAKIWVKKGNSVTQFSSSFEGGPEREVIDGVNIIRKGHPDARFLFSSVHFLAFVQYIKEFRGKFDVIVDEIHGLPFFTPIFVRRKKVVLICEVAGELWYEMFGSFFGSIGRLVEKFFLRFLYQDIPFLTISESSKAELLKNGVKDRNIFVLPMGVNPPRKNVSREKEKDPTLIFVGRLSKPKGIEDAIYALKKVLVTHPRARLWVVGRGGNEYLKYLKKLAQSQGVSGKIKWYGYVSDEKKYELIGASHILLMPSVKEGWGLTVPEAAFVGTPSVVYDSAGLRDVLKGSPFKLIVKENSPNGLASEVVRILDDKSFYEKLKTYRLSSDDYSWDHAAELALSIFSK